MSESRSGQPVDYFRKVARRKVNKDRTITFNGRLFEGPVALIGKRVELLYHDKNLFVQTAITAIQQGSGGLPRKANHLVGKEFILLRQGLFFVG